jgi:hypothetical protein
MYTMYTMYRISIRCTVARAAAGCYTLSSLPSPQHTPLSASPHSLSHSHNPATCNTRIVCQSFTYFLLSQYVERSKKGHLVPLKYGPVLGRKSGLAVITFFQSFCNEIIQIFNLRGNVSGPHCPGQRLMVSTWCLSECTGINSLCCFYWRYYLCFVSTWISEFYHYLPWICTVRTASLFFLWSVGVWCCFALTHSLTHSPNFSLSSSTRVLS